jgi:hypothetical protein
MRLGQDIRVVSRMRELGDPRVTADRESSTDETSSGGILGQHIDNADEGVVVERPLVSGLWVNEVRTPAEIRALDLAYAALPLVVEPEPA